MSVLIGAVAWWVRSRTDWLSLPTASPESMDAMGLAIRGVLLAVGLWLVLAPVAVYLAAANEPILFGDLADLRSYCAIC